MTNIQLIEKQNNIFRFNINGTKAGLFPLKVKVKGKWVSYNQIRMALKQAR